MRFNDFKLFQMKQNLYLLIVSLQYVKNNDLIVITIFTGKHQKKTDCLDCRCIDYCGRITIRQTKKMEFCFTAQHILLSKNASVWISVYT